MAAGQPVSAFWWTTPGEVGRALRAARKARETQIEEARALNHELAQLIAYAFHAPNKMPKYRAIRPRRTGAVAKHPDRIDAEEVLARHIFRRWAQQGRP